MNFGRLEMTWNHYKNHMKPAKSNFITSSSNCLAVQEVILSLYIYMYKYIYIYLFIYYSMQARLKILSSGQGLQLEAALSWFNVFAVVHRLLPNRKVDSTVPTCWFMMMLMMPWSHPQPPYKSGPNPPPSPKVWFVCGNGTARENSAGISHLFWHAKIEKKIQNKKVRWKNSEQHAKRKHSQRILNYVCKYKINQPKNNKDENMRNRFKKNQISWKWNIETTGKETWKGDPAINAPIKLTRHYDCASVFCHIPKATST